jgi:hypothetical protein
MAQITSTVFTTSITNTTFTITERMGLQQVSVYNGSSVTGTVTGTRVLGATSSSAINVAEGETITMKSIQTSVLVDVVITAPASCTLTILAQ